jgi:hypothetical protein
VTAQTVSSSAPIDVTFSRLKNRYSSRPVVASRTVEGYCASW